MPAPRHVLSVQLMDEDHARLEALLATIGAASDAELPVLLADVERETREHFAREEDLMQSVGVPIYHCHVAQHNLVLDTFARAHASVAAGDMAAVRAYLSHELPVIIDTHIDSVDRVTASLMSGAMPATAVAGLRLPLQQ